MNIEELLYKPSPEDAIPFDGLYRPPDIFAHAEWYTVAMFTPTDDLNNGDTVEIDEARTPARFFRLRTLGNGRHNKLTLVTSSGVGFLPTMVQLAKLIADDRISVYED